MREDANKQFWERIAKGYTLFQEKGNKKFYDTLCDKIKPLLNEKQSVLELACGTGQLTGLLANTTKEWRATDFSKKMVAEAEKRFKTQKVIYEVQDATHLAYEDHVFDVVLIANALHIMPKPDEALKEIKRVLKEDGLMIAPTFVHEGKVNKLRLGVMEKVGFRTFYQWTDEAYSAFVASQGFEVMRHELIDGGLLPECILVCRQKKK